MAASEKCSAIRSKRILREASTNELSSRTVASTFVGLLLISEGRAAAKSESANGGSE
jgi:hypothetical protein